MLTLLPLQGWTGVAMTTHMAVANLATHQIAHDQASLNDALGSDMSDDMSDDMSVDCALRMGFKVGTIHTSSDKICTDCHACHTIALTDPVLINSTPTFSESFERSSPHYFASADVQLSQKPPIFLA